MNSVLNLADIQGNVVRAYGAYGYARARYFFLHIDDAAAGRAFIDTVRKRVTTAERWARGGDGHKATGNFIARPKVTLNIAFTFYGLLALDLPTRTLRDLPDAFIDGMAKRADILGDIRDSAPDKWDRVWQHTDGPESDRVHVWISMNALIQSDGEAVPELETETQWLRDLCGATNGVRLLSGNGPQDLDYQDAGAKLADGPDGKVPTGKEHFGYTDGIGNPVFEGQYPPEVEKVAVIGRGKIMPDQSWKPIATGEFLIGHPDESQGLPAASKPWEFTHNGSFLVYRKLHQNVATFANYIDRMAEEYARLMDTPANHAAEIIKAKMAGRWTDGVPLMAAGTYSDWQAFKEKWKGRERSPEFRVALIDFKYRDDIDGIKCPVSAHIRRANTRDTLDPNLASKDPKDWGGSALNKRRRILRRGLPYGDFNPNATDESEQGIIFIVVCADIFRQFEFVQQQWIQYGLDFNAGNDTCPMLGTHDETSKFVIASDPKTKKPPFICSGLPQFVTTRGGDYFFLPSMTALRMMAMGTIDPT